MSRTLVITCDWCLDPSPVLNPTEVVVEGLNLDLCADHASKWEGMTKSSGGFRPRAASSAGAASTPETESVPSESVSGTPSRSTEFHVAKKLSTRTSQPGKATSAKAKAAKPAKASKVAKKGAPSRTSGGQKLRASVDSSAVRAWAQSNGIAVPARGPLKASIIEQFLDSPLNKKSKVPSASFTSAS